MSHRLPAGIVALGIVSLLMDVSSEMIHGLLPLFLTGTLGASAAMVGLIEGVGEATAAFAKLGSGLLSDRWRRRKPLALAGYGLSALTKPLFALAGSPGPVLAARFADRIGKGIRGAPRDALVADLTPPAQRGAAFGLRQSLDTVGAVVGPLLAMALMALWAEPRLVFALAVLPALAAVAVLARGVQEPPRDWTPAPPPRLDRAALAALGRGFWAVVALAGVMTLARISEAFLILRAGDLGLTLAAAPLVLVVMNLIYAGAAWPAGALSDRIGRRGLLIAGFGVLAVAQLVLALAPGLGVLWAGVALWGLHMGLTQGLLAAEVARHAPPERRGTAFGVFNLVSGGMLLAGNGLAGLGWATLGARPVLLALAACAALGTLGLALATRPRPAPPVTD